MSALRQIISSFRKSFHLIGWMVQSYAVIIALETVCLEQSSAQIIGTTQLAFPSNGSSNQPTMLVCGWYKTVGASGYQLQVSTSSSFGTTMIDASPISDTSKQVGPLNNGTLYYWRVRALGIIASGNWSDVWSFTTILPLPDIPTQLSPKNGQTNAPTTPTLSWTSAAGADTYRLQVATNTSFTPTLLDNNAINVTSQQVGPLANITTYYWRVLATNKAGSSNWSTTWNFTTIPAIPSPPTLVSPADGTTGISTNVTLNWNGVSGASSYRVQVSTNSIFSSMVIDQGSLTTPSYGASSLKENSTYYWRVNASNSGGTGYWSPTWSFTTALAPPAAPTLVAPSDGATGVATSPTLRWNAVSGASFYHLQISTNAGFSAIVTDQNGISSTSYDATGLLNSTIYHWRVSAVNSSGESNWSTVWKFMTAASTPIAPATPTLISPTDNSINQSTSLTLSWNSTPRTDRYHLQVSANTAFNVNVFNDSTLTATSAQVGMLAKNAVYYWRVNASNAGGTSPWSAVWQFSTTPEPLTAPVLVSPQNGTTSQPVTLMLSWNSSTGAASYHLQVSTADSFATNAVDDTALAQTSQQVGPLAKGTMYYWHVKAKNSQTTSPWSTIWNFTTEQPQAGPTLVSPPNGASDQPTTLVLTWSSVSGALSYELQVSTSSAFVTTVFSNASISGTSQQISSLSNGTTYYWRVRANYLLFPGDWSSVWSFKTIQVLPPPAPQLVTPADGLVNQPTTITFGWNNASGATAYHLQVAPSSSFATMVANDSTLNTTSLQVNSLAANVTYYWRVRARNVSGWSPYSNAWSFSTATSSSSTLSLHATVNFPAYNSASEFQAADYRLIGLPGNSNLDLAAFASGTAESEWIAFWDNGAPADYFIRYDGSSLFNHTTGRAFWFIHKGPWNINASAPAAPLNAAQQAEIPLHQGWNLITNPFLSPISWSTIQSLNGISEPIQTFNGTFAVSSSLDPYIGYYFFNATSLSALKIPYSSSPSTAAASASIQTRENTADWRVRVSLSSPQGSDNLLLFGVSTTALEGKDEYDFHKARGVSSVPSSLFFKPEWDARYSSFASDIRPPLKEKECARWDITISVPRGKLWDPIDISFDGVEHIPPELDVYLVDRFHSTVVNLRDYSKYRFTPVAGTSIVSVLAGKSETVHELMQSMNTPQNYVLGANYPNPFNPSTTIPVELPVTSAITLKIFSIVGQEIKILYTGTLQAGKYWFRWDGTNEAGRIVPSGTYFYRFSSSQGVMLTKKMILMK